MKVLMQRVRDHSAANEPAPEREIDSGRAHWAINMHKHRALLG
jgi:hypothetical protein